MGAMAAWAQGASACAWNPARLARCSLSSSSMAFKSVGSSDRAAGVAAAACAGAAAARGWPHRRHLALLA
eukprot:6993585-Lingulodinium_polyedra.AAC.1